MYYNSISAEGSWKDARMIAKIVKMMNWFS